MKGLLVKLKGDWVERIRWFFSCFKVVCCIGWVCGWLEDECIIDVNLIWL